METATAATAAATIVGVITAIVSWWVLRRRMGIDSPMLGACVGLLAGIGLATRGGNIMSGLTIPYEALGIAIVVLLFLIPLWRGKEHRDNKPLPPESRKTNSSGTDPWEREIRSGGKMANRFGRRDKK